MSTSPNCPQCAQPGVRTVQVPGSGDRQPRLVWVCENDHRFS